MDPPIKPSGIKPKLPFHMIEHNNPDIVHQFFPFFRVFNDGRVQRFKPIQTCPPSEKDPVTGVQSKDVVISSDPNISARLFLPPKSENPGQKKLPLLLYIHGGGFSIESAFSTTYHNYVMSLVAQANVVAVSVEYRLAPENPIPACYDDSWEALKWVGSHSNGSGPDPWINEHADLTRVFVAGDSAGANITHTLVFRIGTVGLPGVKVIGAAMIHPFFGGETEDLMEKYMCPTYGGVDDPRMRPGVEDLARIGCDKVLVVVAEEDHLKERGLYYFEQLKKSAWKGSAEIEENKGQDHVFHLTDPHCDNAVALMEKLVSFINSGDLYEYKIGRSYL